MIASRLLLLGSTLCLGACLSSGYPEIRPIAGQASAPQAPFERAFAEGKHELASGHPGLAIVAFEKASRIDPLSVGALNGIGASYDALKRYDVALGYYQRALLLAPKNTATINNIAVSLRLAHDPAADQWFEKAVKLSPDDPVVAANIAQARLETAHGNAGEPIREATADEPDADAGSPTLQRSGVAAFNLGVPITKVAFSDPADSTVRAVPPAVEMPKPAPPPPPAPASAPPQPASPSRATAAPDGSRQTPVSVANCAGRTHMAHRFGDFLRSEGIAVGHITNAPSFDCEKSRLLARSESKAQAEALARLLPQSVETETDDTMNVPVRLVLGRDLIAFDRTLGG